jgi:enoyl-CoA hydratase
LLELQLTGPGPNAMHPDLLANTLTFLEDARRQDAPPLWITGRGNAFSAGVDLRALAGMDAAQVSDFLDLLERVAASLFLYPAPVVAWVNGHAIAGGCMLATCCDLRIGARTPGLRMGMNAVALGLQYPPTLLAILRHRLPVHTVETVLLGARLTDAAGARRLGLLDALGDEGDAREALERRAQLPREAYAATKLALRTPGIQVPEEERLAWRRDRLPAWQDSDLRSRLAARLK